MNQIYDYRDESGDLVQQVIRKPGKKFIQRRPAQSGETWGEQQALFHDGGWWIYSTSGIETVPYHCAEITNAPAAIRIVIVEGEKDADNLAAREPSVVTTTTPGGAARKWEASWTKYFANRDVIICPDCDEPGLKYAQNVAAAILGVSARVRIVNWNKLWHDRPAGRKIDISDWLEAHPDEKKIIERLHPASDDALPMSLRDSSNGNGSSTPKSADFDDDECGKCADQTDFASTMHRRNASCATLWNIGSSTCNCRR